MNSTQVLQHAFNASEFAIDTLVKYGLFSLYLAPTREGIETLTPEHRTVFVGCCELLTHGQSKVIDNHAGFLEEHPRAAEALADLKVANPGLVGQLEQAGAEGLLTNQAYLGTMPKEVLPALYALKLSKKYEVCIAILVALRARVDFSSLVRLIGLMLRISAKTQQHIFRPPVKRELERKANPPPLEHRPHAQTNAPNIAA